MKSGYMPKSKTDKWKTPPEIYNKLNEEFKKGKKVVMLINAITDTKAFHEYINGNSEIRFIKGRVKFINPDKPYIKTPSPKPSMIVIFK